MAMAVKYRKTNASVTTPTILIRQSSSSLASNAQQTQTFIKGSSGLVINKIPATIKPTLKRGPNATFVTEGNTIQNQIIKQPKYTIQTVANAGTPQTTLQWQQTLGNVKTAANIGGAGTTISSIRPIIKTEPEISSAIHSLPPNTIIQAAEPNKISNAISYLHSGTTITPISNVKTRPTIYIKRPQITNRTVRVITIEMIEKNPQMHLGVNANRLQLLKNVICQTANVTYVDCCLTLKKLKQNENFTLLAEYFEMNEDEVQQIFSRTIVRLARYLRFLISWPDNKKYYNRRKILPFEFRQNLSHVQSLIECVETDMQPSMQADCNNYKFILCITTSGLISYISEAFTGHHDDISIFNAAEFNNIIPKYLSLVVDPGKAIRRRNDTSDNIVEYDSSTDDIIDCSNEDIDNTNVMSKHTSARLAAELSSTQSLQIVNNELVSRRVKDFSIPTMRVNEPICRYQIRHMLDSLREFKILQPHAIQEQMVYQFLNEILIVAAALLNLQR